MDYKIVYSKRKTLQICVKADGSVVVSCPKGTSKSYIERFVASKSGWINTAIVKSNKKLTELAGFYRFENIYLFGAKLELESGADKNYIDGGCIHVKNLKELKKLLSDSFGEYLANKMKEVSQSTGLNYKSLNIKDYKSRWGCCSVKGDITFNYKIFMLPERLIYYNIVHELCHTVYFDHSKNFWNLVERFLPDYKELKKELKDYNFITRLY